MHLPLTPSALDITTSDPASLDLDWIVLPVFEGEDRASLGSAGERVADAAARAVQPGDFRGKRFEWLTTPPGEGWSARRLVLLGAGPAGDYSPDWARRLAASAIIQGRERGAARLAFVHRQPAGLLEGREAAWVQAEAEGLTLGEFSPGVYKTGPEDRRPNPAAILAFGPHAGADEQQLREAAERGRQLAHCANLARELVNEPGNELPPRLLAERARELAAGTALTVEVLEEGRMADLGMGLLLGVAQGSRERARLIVVTHAPEAAPPSPCLGLVGKGVTFDSGGLSIKTAEGMERMKDDMAGGAAVLLAMRAISLLKAPIRVIGVVPSVENMPGGNAIRPGDVLRGASGRTVEVLNTDAEGRLILGDALWYAQHLGATHLVDIATLTGACAVALGKTATGVFGRPDDWRERVAAVANRCGERAWPMPVFDDYKDLVKSEIADPSYTGGRYGGAITAALFVGEFARERPWAHLDVAGPAWNDEAKPYLPKGPTGVGVRTLAELAFTF